MLIQHPQTAKHLAQKIHAWFVHEQPNPTEIDAIEKVLRSSKVASGDQTKLKVEWADGIDLTDLIGKPVRFRFHQAKGSLYAFWVTPDEKGSSNGYVGAGGPDFGGVRDITR